MIIPCPKCQARLDLPEGAAGVEVRCPTCRHAFRATSETGPRAVEEGPPKRLCDAKPAPPPRHPLDDDPYDLPPRPRRFDGDLDLREAHADTKVLEDNAREHTRFAGQVMLAAGFGTLGGLIVNRVIAVFQDLDQGLGRNNPVLMTTLVLGTFSRLILFGPLLVIILNGGRNLLSLGSRGTIKGGIAGSFIVAGALALGVLIDLVSLSALFGGSSPLVIPQIVVSCLSSGACLTAGILAIRALSELHVSQYFDLRRDRFRRFRY